MLPADSSVLGPAPAPDPPLSDSVRRSMQSNRPRDTKLELRLRSVLHARGLRFRTNYRPIKTNRCTVDIAFTRLRLAVLLDGCFWHGCPAHGQIPAHNSAWWDEKLRRNRERDKEVTGQLVQAGWVVLRYWEHESIDSVARDVVELVRWHKLGLERSVAAAPPTAS